MIWWKDEKFIISQLKKIAMKKIFLFIRNQYQVIFKGFLFILAVAILVWIFPKEGLFKYEFSEGKPWLHEDLYAPFNFAISKTDENIATEKLEAVQGLPYYFKYIGKFCDWLFCKILIL